MVGQARIAIIVSKVWCSHSAVRGAWAWCSDELAVIPSALCSYAVYGVCVDGMARQHYFRVSR